MAILERRKSVKGMAAFTVRVPPEVKEKLEEMAYRKKMSLGVVVGEVLAREADCTVDDLLAEDAGADEAGTT